MSDSTDYLERFSEEFIEKRRLALQSFLFRIVEHPVLRASKELHTFLEAKAFVPPPPPTPMPKALETAKSSGLKGMSKFLKSLSEGTDEVMTKLRGQRVGPVHCARSRRSQPIRTQTSLRTCAITHTKWRTC
jgi:hypothetical protein